MTATQRFIEKAIEGGWKPNRYTKEQWERIKHLYPESGISEWQLDPLAWKAVGKVLGWEDSLWVGQMSQLVGEKLETHKWEVPQWQYQMHRMLDALAEGKTPNQYLESIMGDYTH